MARKVFALHNRSEVFCGSFANDFIPFMAMSSQSLCVTCFSFPSNDVSFDFFFSFFLGFFNIHSSVRVWKSFGAALIFVWSIQSHFSCFPFFLAPEKIKFGKNFLQDIPATTQQKGKSMQIVPAQKKRNREFCHVVLLLIMEQNAEIPFAKAILQYTTTTTMFHLFFLFRFLRHCNVKKFHQYFFREFFSPRRLMFLVVVVVVVICTRTKFIASHCIWKLELNFHLICVSAYKRHTKAGVKGTFFVWIEVREIEIVNKIKLCRSTLFHHHHRLAKVTFN